MRNRSLAAVSFVASLWSTSIDLSSALRTSAVVVSSTLMEKAVSEIWRMLKPAARARSMKVVASLVSQVTVSKKAS